MTDRPDLSKRRIAFFTSVIGMGGSEVVVADAMEAAHAAGAELVCWCHPQAAIRQILAARPHVRVALRDWPPADLPAKPASPGPDAGFRLRSRLWRRLAPAALRRLAGFLLQAKQFSEEIDQVKPEVMLINVNGSEAATLAAFWRLGRRTLGCYHLSVARFPGKLLDGFIDWILTAVSMWSAGHVVHTSRAVRDQWSRLCIYPRSRTTVIYNGVDGGARLSRQDLRTEMGIEPGVFVFCVPGRLHPVKGHRHLLDALAFDPTPFRNARVLICGEGPLRDELERQCAAAGLTGIVKFLGWRKDLARVLQASDCAVLPSIASENLSVAVLEALMAGTPAVVTWVGGMAEAVRHGINGLVVPPASAPALRQALLGMMADPRGARQMGEQARRDAERRFTRSRMMSEYAQLFASVCEVSATRARGPWPSSP